MVCPMSVQCQIPKKSNRAERGRGAEERKNCSNGSWIPLWCFTFSVNESFAQRVISCDFHIAPIGSMGLVYLPTWMVDFDGKCR